MDPITLAAGSALVTAMATDGWQQARDAVVTWWRSRRADEADGVRAELESLRTQALAARDESGRQEEAALAAAWGARFQRLLDDDPDLASALQELIRHALARAAATAEHDDPSVVLKADARDNARVYMAGHDQHITGS